MSKQSEAPVRHVPDSTAFLVRTAVGQTEHARHSHARRGRQIMTDVGPTLCQQYPDLAQGNAVLRGSFRRTPVLPGVAFGRLGEIIDPVPCVRPFSA